MVLENIDLRRAKYYYHNKRAFRRKENIMNTIAPGGAVPEKPDKMFEFKKVRLNVQGMMASAREYEALRTKDGVEVSIYDGPWSYNDNITREDCLQSGDY